MALKRSRDEDEAPRKHRERVSPAATTRVTATRTAPARMLGAHRRAEEKLAAANLELRHRIAEGKRLESRRRARANKTLRNIRAAWVKEQQVLVSGGSITEYQVNMMVTFVIDD